MAFFLRFRRPPAADDAGGSGGKLLRGRRREPLPSPYSRPGSPSPSTPAPPPPPLLLPTSPAPPAGSPKWVLGLITGAGKMISSVFRPNDSSTSSTSSSASGYSSCEEDAGHSSHEKEDNNVPTQVQLLNQGENALELPNCEERSKEIIVMSESKLAIEQLLMKETFSRDEFIKLTKLLQSRVIDSPSLEMGQKRTKGEILRRNEDSAASASTCWEPVSQRRELAESVPSSHNMLNHLSPIYPATLTFASETHNTRVMEAKKWLEDRRLASHSKSDISCGPCVLNTDMLNSDLYNEVGSPVNVAKSYMRSLPPWQSPSLSSNYINTSPSRKVNLFKDESTNESGNHSSISFKAFKRNYLSSISLDSPDETRRVRMRSTGNLVENTSPNLKETDFDKLFEKESLKISSSPDRAIGKNLGDCHDLAFVQAAETSNAPINFSPECAVNQHSTDTLKLADEKAVSSNPPTIDEVSSISLASEPEPAAKTVVLLCQSVLPVVNSLEASHVKTESAPKLDDKKLDAKEPSITEDHCALIGSQESVGFASGSMEHDGNPLHKTKGETAEANKFTKHSYAEDVSNSKDDSSNMHTVEELAGTLGVNSTTKLNLDLGTKPHDDDPSLKVEANGTANKPAKNGSPAELNTNGELQPVDKCNLTFGYSENGEKSGGSCERSSEAVQDKPAVLEADISGAKSENGTKMKSVERVLTTEPLSGATHYRRKVVFKKKRGRTPR